MRSALLVVASLCFAASAAAQQRPIFDPDDFVDPRERDQRLFISRLVLGATRNFIDDFRPLGDDVVALHLTNSVYWSQFQLDYKHTEMRVENGGSEVRVCGCEPPVYFPTPPSEDSVPAASRPERRDMLQFGWYWPKGAGAGRPPIMLRSRISASYQPVDTVVRAATTEEVVSRLSGHEWSLGLDTDTHFRLRGRNVFGSLFLTRLQQEGTIDDRSQTSIAYLQRFPAVPVKEVLLRATLTIAAVSDRGAAGINVVSPAFEAFWHDHRTQANVHLVWNPMALRDGDGWRTRHQIAVFIDRALYVKLFGREEAE